MVRVFPSCYYKEDTFRRDCFFSVSFEIIKEHTYKRMDENVVDAPVHSSLGDVIVSLIAEMHTDEEDGQEDDGGDTAQVDSLQDVITNLREDNDLLD